MKTAIFLAVVCDQIPLFLPASNALPMSGLIMAFIKYGEQVIIAFWKGKERGSIDRSIDSNDNKSNM